MAQRTPRKSSPRPLRARPLSLERLEGRDLPSFLAPVSYKLGGHPAQVAVGDLNHDGRRDVVVSLQNSNYVVVMLGDGTGALGAPAYYIAYASLSLQVADVNNDGNADVVVGGRGDSPGAVLLGKGDGTLQPKIPFGTGGISTLDAVADFDHDGKLDLALTYGEGAQPVGILRGNGDGTFQAPVFYGSGMAQGHLRAGDLNGDGWADLVLTDGPSNALGVFLNRGDGTFQAPQSVPACNSPGQVEVGDLNKDGRLDVAVTCNIGTVGLFLGNGDGTFEPHQDFPTGNWPGWIVVGDFNRDRKPDVATSSSVQSDPFVSVLLGNGNGTFKAPAEFQASGSGFGFTAADLNNDRYPDLVVATDTPSTVDVLMNDGNWTAPVPPPGPGRQAVTIAVTPAPVARLVGTPAPVAAPEPVAARRAETEVRAVPHRAAIGDDWTGGLFPVRLLSESAV
jgi:hypothetical protein